MLFDKLIWTGVSPIRKDSTYISLEYVVNDLGIFCKGEQRTKDVGFATSRIGAPLGLTAVEGCDYAAKSLGRIVILWNKITDVQEDSEKGVILVTGNASDKIVIQYDAVNKAELLSRIESMRQFCPVTAESDAKAAAWLAWAYDKNIETPFAPLDELIEKERLNIDNRSYSDVQLTATELPADAVPDEKNIAPVLCPRCGAAAKENAKFCTQCGNKL